MQTTIQSLLNDYFNWYEKRFSINELKEAHEIVTPFVNQINDRISLFIEFDDNNQIIISDDGVTIDELLMNGIDINTATRERIIKNIIENFKLEINGEIIYTIAKDINSFSQAQHNMIQGILQINDILFTERINVVNLFREEVFDFFYEEEFGGTIEPDLKGASGIKYNIDYSLGGTPRRPQTLIKLLQDPNFTNVAAQKYISDDLKTQFIENKMSVKYVIIANDIENVVPSKSKKAAEDMGIEMIEWSNKESILALK